MEHLHVEPDIFNQVLDGSLLLDTMMPDNAIQRRPARLPVDAGEGIALRPAPLDEQPTIEVRQLHLGHGAILRPVERQEVPAEFLVMRVGTLPTREVLLAQFLGMLAAPVRSFLYLLDQKSKQTVEATN